MIEIKYSISGMRKQFFFEKAMNCFRDVYLQRSCFSLQISWGKLLTFTFLVALFSDGGMAIVGPMSSTFKYFAYSWTLHLGN